MNPNQRTVAAFDSLIQALADEYPLGLQRRALVQWAEEYRKKLISAPSSAIATAPRDDSTSTQLSGQQVAAWLRNARRQSHLKSQLKIENLYPWLLMLIFCLLGVFLGPVVIEPFRQMFDEFGLTLPVFTKWLMNFSRAFFASPGKLLSYCIVVPVVFLAMRWLLRRYTPISRFFPWISAGNRREIHAMAAFTSRLADQLELQVPLAQAMESASQECPHRQIARCGRELAQHVQTRAEPLVACRASAWFPKNVLWAIDRLRSDGLSTTTAPPVSSSITLLRELSAMYAQRAGDRHSYFPGGVGTFGMLMVWGLIFFIIVALFLPLVELVSGLS